MLLDQWSDDRIQESLESSGRNIVVYRRMADRFNRALRYGVQGTDGLSDRGFRSRAEPKIKASSSSIKRRKKVHYYIVLCQSCQFYSSISQFPHIDK